MSIDNNSIEVPPVACCTIYFPSWLNKLLYPLIILLVLSIVLIPIWSTNIPPLLDYHNHLARQYILANIQESRYFDQFYQINLKASPYLAMDALIQGFGLFVPIDIAGKIFLSLMLLLLALAPISLNLVLFGRVTPFALVGLLFLYNQTLSLGFVNYLFSVGYAICLLALWIRLRDASLWIRLVLFPVLCSTLFFSHLIGFVIYGLMVGSYELGCYLTKEDNINYRNFLNLDRLQKFNFLSLSLQCVIPLTIFYAFGPSTGQISSNTYGGIVRKYEILIGIFSYLITPYAWTLDRITIILLPVICLLLVIRRRLAIPRLMWWPIGAVLLLFFLMPMELFSGWGADHRLMPALGLLLVGCIRPNNIRSGLLWSSLVSGIIVLVVLRVITVSAEWHRANQEYLEYQRAFNSISDGSKIYFAFGHKGGKHLWPAPVYHLPCLVVSKKEVYVPHLFASDSGLFTLQYQSKVEPLGRLDNGPVLLNGETPKWNKIIEHFDYFFLVKQRFFSNSSIPSNLKLVFDGKDVKVYKRI